MQFPIPDVFGQSKFSIGDGSVFTNTSPDESAPFPPVEGYFLFLNTQIFGLLNSTLLPAYLSLL